MRAAIRAMAVPVSERREMRSIGCVICSRQDVSGHDIARMLDGGPPVLCGRCRRELDPTPLDIVLEAAGMTAVQFSETTGLALRSVIRATKGEKMSKKFARRLAAITKFPPETWTEVDPRRAEAWRPEAIG